jgi:two-component system CheB/CheR fusion protein
MQSMNEELQTVNHELLAKVDELSQVSDDMKNLLNSTEIATLFLDEELKVRRFTPQTASIIKLIPSDVGRPITDLVTKLDYPTLAEDARQVLSTLIFQERTVPAGDEHWFTVRIMPYRTQDNRIDGVVITFINISATKALEATLREAQSVLQIRFTDQTAELDTAKQLEAVLQKAQAVLEKRFGQQTAQLRQAREDLQTKKERRP